MSTVAGEAIRQDMPPPGGYKKIPFARIPAKTYFSGYQLLGIYTAVTAASYYVYYLTCKKVTMEQVEMRSAQNVIIPILTAERDREYLKQLSRNRDEEAKLMANVPGWEVGTWYGEPIFKTIPKDKLVNPQYSEFYAHAAYKDYARRAHIKLWN